VSGRGIGGGKSRLKDNKYCRVFEPLIWEKGRGIRDRIRGERKRLAKLGEGVKKDGTSIYLRKKREGKVENQFLM